MDSSTATLLTSDENIEDIALLTPYTHILKNLLFKLPTSYISYEFSYINYIRFVSLKDIFIRSLDLFGTIFKTIEFELVDPISILSRSILESYVDSCILSKSDKYLLNSLISYHYAKINENEPLNNIIRKILLNHFDEKTTEGIIYNLDKPYREVKEHSDSLVLDLLNIHPELNETFESLEIAMKRNEVSKMLKKLKKGRWDSGLTFNDKIEIVKELHTDLKIEETIRDGSYAMLSRNVHTVAKGESSPSPKYIEDEIIRTYKNKIVYIYSIESIIYCIRIACIWLNMDFISKDLNVSNYLEGVVRQFANFELPTHWTRS